MTPGRGIIATIGGLPAAIMVRRAGMKSRACWYWVLMPVCAVKSSRTFWKSACSLPPQSESTVSTSGPAGPVLIRVAVGGAAVAVVAVAAAAAGVSVAAAIAVVAVAAAAAGVSVAAAIA